MGELGGRQLCAFDPASGELYASVSSDNRLRIWNTVRSPLGAPSVGRREGGSVHHGGWLTRPSIHTQKHVVLSSQDKPDSPILESCVEVGGCRWVVIYISCMIYLHYATKAVT